MNNRTWRLLDVVIPKLMDLAASIKSKPTVEFLTTFDVCGDAVAVLVSFEIHPDSFNLWIGYYDPDSSYVELYGLYVDSTGVRVRDDDDVLTDNEGYYYGETPSTVISSLFETLAEHTIRRLSKNGKSVYVNLPAST